MSDTDNLRHIRGRVDLIADDVVELVKREVAYGDETDGRLSEP